MKNFIHTVVTDGKTYNYFRPTGEMRRHKFPSLRLSDDINLAREEALALARLKPEMAHGGLMDQIATVVSETRRRARKNQVAFELTEAQVKGILKRQGHVCALTGLPFDLEHRGDFGEAFRRPFAPSLDRINPRGGYVIRNVRVVCVAVNIALNEWGFETLLTVTEALLRETKKQRSKENALENAAPFGGPPEGISSN